MDQPSITAKISQIMLGAGLIAFGYVLLTPRVFPDVFPPDTVASGPIGPLRALVGMLIGAALMTAWSVFRRVSGPSRTR